MTLAVLHCFFPTCSWEATHSSMYTCQRTAQSSMSRRVTFLSVLGLCGLDEWRPPFLPRIAMRAELRMRLIWWPKQSKRSVSVASGGATPPQAWGTDLLNIQPFPRATRSTTTTVATTTAVTAIATTPTTTVAA